MKKTDKLNLLICGAQRSGTTSLKHYLAEHPDIAFIGEKDLYWRGEYIAYPFCTPFYSKASTGEEAEVYIEISKKYSGKVAYIGTKWPYFMLFPHIACNIRLHLPNAKLLFILRNPVDALYSSYWHSRQKRNVDLSFDEMVEQTLAYTEEKWIPQSRSSWPEIQVKPHEKCWRVERGFYFQQIKNFYNLFNPAQILVLQFDEMVKNPAETMKKVLRFLELSQSFKFKKIGEKMNASPFYPPMSSEMREKLAVLYADTNRKLFDLMDWPEDLW